MFALAQQYSVLGVSPTATLKEVKSAYIRLARQFHPDKLRQPATEVISFVAIRNAYETINAEHRRRQAELQQRKLANSRGTLNLIMNLLENNDSSSDSEELDDYFEARMRVVDEQCQRIQSILGGRNGSLNKLPTKLAEGRQDSMSITTNASETSPHDQHPNSFMIDEDDTGVVAS